MNQDEKHTHRLCKFKRIKALQCNFIPFLVQFWSLCNSQWVSWHMVDLPAHFLYLCLQTPHLRCWSGPVSNGIKQSEPLGIVCVCVCVKQRYKRMKRFPVSHLYSGLEASLDNCARTLNVDPLKQLSVIAGGGWRGAVEDQ